MIIQIDILYLLYYELLYFLTFEKQFVFAMRNYNIPKFWKKLAHQLPFNNTQTLRTFVCCYNSKFTVLTFEKPSMYIYTFLYYYTLAQRYKYSAYGNQMSNDNIFKLNTAG